MSAGNSIKAIPMITVDTSTLNDVTYTEVTSGGLSEALGILRFYNANSRDIILSYDGITAHDIIAGTSIYPITTQLMATPANFVAAFKKGTQIYLKLTSAPGFGNLYIVGYYQN
jgi:hypothetical protein